MGFDKFRRYAVTISYLKAGQIWGRLWFKCRRPRAAVRPAPPTAKLSRRTGFAPGYTVLTTEGFRFLNVVHKLDAAADWNRAEWGKLWLYNLHYFGREGRAPLQTKQGNRPTARDQKGRRGSDEVVPGTSMFPSSKTGMSGNFWSHIKGAKYRFKLQDGT